jgi:MYXO-CTERM domain-containing protein
MSHRSFVIGLPLLAGLGVLSGCGAGQESGGELLGTTDERIMGGTSDSGDHNVVDIVWLMSSSSFSECSGSLLAPNMVLTAHHCVSTLINAVNGSGVDCSVTKFAAPSPATDFYVSTAEVLSTNLSTFHTVKEIVVPPSSTNTKLCGVDQAILILSDNIAASDAVPLIPRVDTQMKVGESYTAVGFGLTSDTATNSAGTRRRLTGLHVKCVGTPCDALTAPGQIDATHEYIGDHGTCEGDSGGPALDQYNRVAGVTSRGGAGCTDPIYGDVFAWGSWISQTAQKAAQLGGYPAPPWSMGYPTDPAYSEPIGGACNAPNSPNTCPSNLCLQDDAGSYCTRVCETQAPCPTGYTCETIENVQLCQRPPPPPPVMNSTTSGGGGPGGPNPQPGAKSGCSMQAADPTKPVPWFFGVGVAAFVLLRRRRAG